MSIRRGTAEEGQVLARHRSPSGAQPEPGSSAPRAPHPGTHRLPPPPAANLRGRVTLAAVAAGAAVAGGQTLVSAFHTEPSVVTAAALLPVAESRDAPPPSGTDAGLAGTEPIGASQAAPGPLRVGPLGGDLGSGGLDPRSAVDVRNLTKATDIGEQIAKRTRVLRSALADGAPEAQLFDGQAFVRPALGRLTSLFGARWGVTHYGIDIANAIGTPIYALTDGVVEESGPATGFGMWVVLRHPNGERSVYGHVNRAYVAVGQQIHAGEHIADIGNRGFSTGPHLHFEVWAPDGSKMNPIPWLARHGLTF
jgi:murein DD-endopeptidase MepM/ murein hydrolase activator NlpD